MKMVDLAATPHHTYSDGSIFIEESGQLTISVTQKYLLDPLQNLYGGRIKILRSK